jgi:hypothetical protein
MSDVMMSDFIKGSHASAIEVASFSHFVHLYHTMNNPEGMTLINIEMDRY